METVKVEVATAKGRALDWMVAKHLGEDDMVEFRNGELRCKLGQFSDGGIYSPTTDASRGMDILFNGSVNLIRVTDGPCKACWAAIVESGQQAQTSHDIDGEFYYFMSDELIRDSDPLVAGMRALVWSGLRRGITYMQVPKEMIE